MRPTAESSYGRSKAVRALLFDFDGTIADTSAAWVSATRGCFAARGFELDDKMLRRLLTSPWPDVVPGLSQAAALVIEDDIVDSIREAYLGCPPTAGLHEFLRGFAAIPKAIVTSSYRERLVAPYLRRHGLDHHFRVVVGSEDTARLKPDPEPVLLALRLLGAGLSGAWMIGNSRADIEAARSAGIGSVGLGDSASGADHVADSMHALGRLLAALMAEDEYRPQRP